MGDCNLCTKRSTCIEDPDLCYEFEPDMDGVAEGLIRDAILAADLHFKRVKIERKGEVLRIVVGTTETPTEDNRGTLDAMVERAITKMNEEHLCLPNGTRLRLSFEEM